MRFVLASASTGRRRVLENAGLDVQVQVSDVDEDAVLAKFAAESDPSHVVCALARAKANAVAQRIGPDPALVLGCDSMLFVDGHLAGKPHTAQVALERWKQQSGGVSILYTGHCLILTSGAEHGESRPETLCAPPTKFTSALFESCEDGQRQITAASFANIHFAQLSQEEGVAYVASKEPLEVAGAFTIDRLGGPFIDHIEGDPHGVVGVSLPLVRRMAKHLGIFWPDLWV